MSNINEQKYAEETLRVVKQCIDEELARLKSRRETILEERKYFNDYFNELKDDEKKDLIDNEVLATSLIRGIAPYAPPKANSPTFRKPISKSK